MDHTDVKMVEIGVHKMLESLVSKIVERSMTYKSKVIEARKLVDAIEDHSRHLSEQKEFTDKFDLNHDACKVS